MSLSGKSRDLQSERLLLRPLCTSDGKAMFDIYSDTEVMKYWACAPVKNLAEAQKIVDEDVEWGVKGEAIVWAVTLRSTSAVIGKCILFKYSPDNRRAEVGYILNRRYWRKGLMFEAMSALIDFSFGPLGLHRLEADTDTENAASLAFLEKLGFRREGLFRERWNVYGEWQDSVMLGLLETDWQQG